MDKEQQRAAFEKWASNALYSLRRDRADGNYSNVLTRNAWIGWQAAIEQASQPQWIPVSERLPPAKQHVWIHCPGFGRAIGRLIWEKESITEWFVTKDDGEYLFLNNEITHWMSLPTEPKEPS